MSEMDTIQPDQLEKWHTSKIVTSNLTCLNFPKNFLGRNDKCHLPHGKKKHHIITPIFHFHNFHAAKSSSWPRIEHPPGLPESVDQLGSDLEVPKIWRKKMDGEPRESTEKLCKLGEICKIYRYT